MVCCVGANSTRGLREKKLDTDQGTRLQHKLKNLANQFTYYALLSSAVILVLMVVVLLIDFASAEADSGAGGKLLAGLVKALTLTVVLLVVSIPEGLPLTIGVSLAFTVKRMWADKLLVRKLDAPEKMGGVAEILCGKTGTITKNDMRVAAFFCEGRYVKNSRKNTFLNCELSQEAVERIKESILYNCEARVEMDATTYVPVGNGTEVSLLRFLQDADIPIHLLIQRKLGRIRASCPFSSEKKRSAVALEHPDSPQTVTIYVKGAPEVIVSRSSHVLTNGGIVDLEEQDIETIHRQVKSMAELPLRALGFAYAEVPLEDWINRYEVEENGAGRALEDALSSGELQLTFLGAFGLRDPLRPKVQSCIKYAKEHGELGVRLVSGDHLETARTVATKAGILTPADFGRAYSVCSAEDFRAAVGGLEQGADGEPTVKNMDAFREVANNLRVLARATAADKHLLVVGLRAMGKSVAVTGDGINDVEALLRADVGLAMGSGCSAAKEAADIVLTDDDFEASLRAVMWGRNVFHNVSRFLQFQVTVNLSVLLTVFAGIIIFGESPLSAVQLLWINLIMDTFAALALSTEPPLPSVIQGAPYSEGASILSPPVWRQILGVSLFNFLVMLFVMLFGATAAGLEYDEYRTSPKMSEPDMPAADAPDYAALKAAYDTDMDAYSQSQAKLRHLTYIFNIFVFLQLFNEINCRKVGRRDFAVFEAFFHNPFFLLVVLGTFAAQVAMCTFLPNLTQTTPLTKGEWGACIAVGATTLVVAAALKLTPEAWVARVPTGKMVDEDTEMHTGVVSKWQGATGAAPQGDGEKYTELAEAGDEERGDNDENFRPV